MKKYSFIIFVMIFLLLGGSFNSFYLHRKQVIGSNKVKNVNPHHLVEVFANENTAGLPKILSPQGFDWHQFAGSELNMITENTPFSMALAAHKDLFEKETGIKVNIELDDLGTVIEKAGLEFNAKSDNYQIIYADPYQILAKYPECFVNLSKFDTNPEMPHVPGGLGDFIQSQLNVVGYAEGNKNKLLALPYDASTMILAYRKDIFQKYKAEFMADHGYDWTPSPRLTWKQYAEIARWINQKVADGTISGVKYGIGQQAKRDDSLMNDFSNILAANGGDYIGKRGHAGGINSDAGLQSAKFYLELIKIAAPGSTSWDWQGLAEAFAKGDIAMAPEWHDFSSMLEDKTKSNVAGKVGWTILPKGSTRHADSFGGTGLAINKYANQKEQIAAWLFLLWSTSPQTQYMLLKSETAGSSTITRSSIFRLPEVQKGMQAGSRESKKMPGLLSMKATLEAWKPNNIYIRPKIPEWQQINTFIFTELSKMVLEKQSPQKTVETIASKSNATALSKR